MYRYLASEEKKDVDFIFLRERHGSIIVCTLCALIASLQRSTLHLSDWKPIFLKEEKIVSQRAAQVWMVETSWMLCTMNILILMYSARVGLCQCWTSNVSLVCERVLHALQVYHS